LIVKSIKLCKSSWQREGDVYMESTICILQQDKESRIPAPSDADYVEKPQTTFSNNYLYQSHTLPHLPFRYNTRKQLVIWAINRMEADMIFQDLLADGSDKI
jgi:hypothetical protein